MLTCFRQAKLSETRGTMRVLNPGAVLMVLCVLVCLYHTVTASRVHKLGRLYNELTNHHHLYRSRDRDGRWDATADVMACVGI